MKKYYFLILLLFILLTSGLYAYLRKPPHEIVHPKIGPITESVYAISTVKSEWYYSLKMGVLSTVEKYYVKEGDFVSTGDKLLRIEENGTIFKAPHQGIVTERPFGIKETISPQTPILKIVDLKNLYLEASIEQLGALKITKGMKVIISFEDFRSKTFLGTIRSVLPKDQDFLIQVSAHQLPSNILPGMSADLSVEIGTKDKATLIPTKAISNGYIVVLKNKKPTKIKIEMGISDSENAEILSPELSVEDEIIVPKKEIL
ncbi:MAG: HlyD family efflux transporter periplasmic adaptor subunit [Bacteriovorax sp.]|nr:HlyD family efflux transporter periplasmic adaptor subunit [Bacteriovorax sp.]